MAGAWIIGGAMVLSTIISSAMAPKPPKPVDNSAFDAAAINRAKKAADTSSTSSLKIAREAARRSGPTQSATLLSGGVEDEELNLGGNLLA
jgi:hypothetical protein